MTPQARWRRQQFRTAQMQRRRISPSAVRCPKCPGIKSQHHRHAHHSGRSDRVTGHDVGFSQSAELSGKQDHRQKRDVNPATRNRPFEVDQFEPGRFHKENKGCGHHRGAYDRKKVGLSLTISASRSSHSAVPRTNPNSPTAAYDDPLCASCDGKADDTEQQNSQAVKE